MYSLSAGIYCQNAPKIVLIGSNFITVTSSKGNDRCVMMLTGTDTIREVILFPTMKPLEN